MKVKAKKCKGVGKGKGRGCGTITKFRHYGLCDDCYKDWLLNTDEGRTKLIRATRIGHNRNVKNENKKKREQTEANKSIVKLINEARLPFQKWIRYRDANESCISCGLAISSIWDAGHFMKAELYTGMIFDERNVHKQCRKCNTYLNGNENLYRESLTKKFGKNWVDKLCHDSQLVRKYSWSRDELVAIKQHYLKLLREINS